MSSLVPTSRCMVGALLLWSWLFNFLFLFFSFIFISWRLITSQHFSGFCHTLAVLDSTLTEITQCLSSCVYVFLLQFNKNVLWIQSSFRNLFVPCSDHPCCKSVTNKYLVLTLAWVKYASPCRRTSGHNCTPGTFHFPPPSKVGSPLLSEAQLTHNIGGVKWQKCN